jgi:hypothetical protein
MFYKLHTAGYFQLLTGQGVGMNYKLAYKTAGVQLAALSAALATYP